MKIMEDKKGARNTLIATVAVFAAAAGAYFMYDFGGTAIFAMVVSGVSGAFCVKKLTSDGFLQILGDGFVVRKGGKQAKINFADIESIDTKTIDTKRGVKILRVEFARKRFDENLIDGLLQRISDNEAAVLNIYEKPIQELCTELKSALKAFKKG